MNPLKKPSFSIDLFKSLSCYFVTVQNLGIHKQNTSLSYNFLIWKSVLLSYFLKLKQQVINARKEQRREAFPSMFMWLKHEIVLKISGYLLNKPVRFLWGLLFFSFLPKLQQHDNTSKFKRKSLGFLLLPVFWQILRFKNNCGNLYVQRP